MPSDFEVIECREPLVIRGVAVGWIALIGILVRQTFPRPASPPPGPCTWCGGRGSLPEDAAAVCLECGGTGKEF